MEPDTKQPSLLRRTFFSPSDGRLRAGWRLLVHTLLVILFLGVFQLAITLLALQLGLLNESNLRDAAQGELGSPLLNLPSVGAVTLATWIAWRWLDRRPFLSIGLGWDRRSALDLAFGILMPGLLFGGIYLVELAAGWLTFQGWAWQDPSTNVVTELSSWLILFIMVGYYEELLSRGYHLQTLIDGLNLVWALVISSAVFAVLHAANPSASVLSTIGIFAAGLFLAYGWIRTGALWIPIGVHIGWNFFQGPIFGFPVSGTQGFHLLEHTVSGPQIVTGGAFGPEAGLLGLAAMAVGTWLTWLYTRDRAGASPTNSPESLPSSS